MGDMYFGDIIVFVVVVFVYWCVVFEVVDFLMDYFKIKVVFWKWECMD